MSTWPGAYVKSNGIQIHYYRTGGDKPPVVINHGAGDDGLCWSRVALALQDDYDVILPDARGHGKTSPGRGDYSTEARVDDLLGLLQALKLERPVIGGHSMGADTAMHLAAAHPSLARAIFLEDPPIFLPGESFTDGKRDYTFQEVGRLMSQYMKLFKALPGFIGRAMARRSNPTYPDIEIEPWVQAKKFLSSDFLNAMSRMQMFYRSPFEVFAEISVPILLFTGDKAALSIMSAESARRAEAANPRLRLVHLAGASHDIRRTRYEPYISALAEFLGRVYAQV